jgi:hypothetical protein
LAGCPVSEKVLNSQDSARSGTHNDTDAIRKKNTTLFVKQARMVQGLKGCCQGQQVAT